MKDKKAQVTIFVIFGLILLIGGVILFYMRADIAEIISEDISVVDEVDTNLRPIKNYVEQCMYDVGLEGFRIIGANGGYLSPMSTNAFRYDYARVDQNDGLMFTEDYFIPYWSYSVDPKDSYWFFQQVRAPSLEDIEQDAKRYLENNLLRCLDNLSDLDYGTDLFIEGVPEVKIQIGEDKILLRTDMPVRIVEDNRVVDEFYTEIPLPFKRYYDVALGVAYSHQQTSFVENMVLALIGYYGRVDSNALPPFFDFKKGYDFVVWSQMDVEMKIKQMMQSYIQTIRFVGAKNSLKLNIDHLDQMEKDFFNKGQINLFNEEYIRDAEISFVYVDAPIYSRVFGKNTDSSTIRPEKYTSSSMIGASTVEHTYKFAYDLTIPVVAELKFDPIFENEEPFVFMVGLESNIRKNLRWIDYAVGNGPIIWDDSFIQYDFGDGVEMTTSELTGLSIPAGQPEKKFFGNEQQFLSGDIVVNIYDDDSMELIEGVSVTIGVGDYASAVIGSTKEQESGEIQFRGKAPLVTNGYLVFDKLGYARQIKKITTREGEDQTMNIRLAPLTTKNVSMRVYDLDVNSYRDLKDNETVIFMISRIDEGDKIVSFSRFLQMGKDSSATLELIPGRYTVDAMLIDGEGVIIPKNCDKECYYDPWPFKTCEYYPDDNIVMQPAMWGGLEFKEEDLFYLSRDNVYGDNELQLSVLRFKTPDCIDGLEDMSKKNALTLQHQTNLLPTFN